MRIQLLNEPVRIVSGLAYTRAVGNSKLNPVDQYFSEFGWMLDDDVSRAEIVRNITKSPESFWDVKRVALVLDVAPGTVRQWARAGKIPATRVGKQWRIRGSDLMKHNEERCSINDANLKTTGMIPRPTIGLSSDTASKRLDALRARTSVDSPSNTSKN